MEVEEVILLLLLFQLIADESLCLVVMVCFLLVFKD